MSDQKQSEIQEQDSLIRKLSSNSEELFEHFYQQFIKSLKTIFAENEKAKPEYAKRFILALMNFLGGFEETTMQGLTQGLKNCADYFVSRIKNQEILKGRTNLVFQTTNELFFEYLNKNWPKETQVSELKKKIIELGVTFAERTSENASIITKHFSFMIRNDQVFYKIFIIGYSKLLEHVLLHYAENSIRFQAIIPEGRPTCIGQQMANELASKGIKTKLIADSNIALELEKVDFVLSGAEAVAANGGIINKIGTYTIAICAKALKKPFYVATESLKFSRLYLLSQKDLPDEFISKTSFNLSSFDQKNAEPQVFQRVFINFFKVESGLIDYTPPEFITLLITDKGIFTPSAVSDELIQIFTNL